MAQANEQQKPSFCQNLSQQCSSFGKFLYNSDTGEVLGRGGKSWAKIGFFYLVFYAFLTGFFVAMMAVFLSTVESPEEGGKPKLTQFIANQPGLTRLGSSFGSYDSAANSSAYADSLIKIFEGIKNNTVYKGECPMTKTDNATIKPCYAPFTSYGDCKPDMTDMSKSMFGLKDKKPCVFIRINKVYGWVPSGSGDYLKLSCSGSGFIKQFPEGFLLNGFPYQGDRSMELPFVAVQVDATMSVDVKCDLQGDGIEISDSYNPSRSFGKIAIKEISAK